VVIIGRIDFSNNQWFLIGLSINIDFQSNVFNWDLNEPTQFIGVGGVSSTVMNCCVPSTHPHKGEKGNLDLAVCLKTCEAWKTMSTILHFWFAGTSTWKGILHALPYEHNMSFAWANQHSFFITLPLLYDSSHSTHLSFGHHFRSIGTSFHVTHLPSV